MMMMIQVVILRRARDHVRQLTAASQRLCAEYSRLRCLHQRLTQRLNVLTCNDQLTQPDTDQTLYMGTFLVQAAA